MVLALAWAVYLVPRALKHHDEIARTRSIDRFSTAMRVLARREPVNRRDARLVVTPPRPAGTATMLVPGHAARRGPCRAAARAAVRRRRHILMCLVALDVTVVAVAALALLPWWSVAVPVTVTLVYLYLCRRQVRRENEALWARPAATAEDGSYAEPQSLRNAQGFEEVSPDEDTVSISAVAVRAAVGAGSVEQADAAAAYALQTQTVAVAVPTADGGSLWDPLPVTLPTYVGKSRVARTVRTIDLSQPGTWSSGRSEADSRLVEEAAAAQQEATGAHGERAVGS